ncbi:MAG: UvrD-helicase domain-containing protein [bacterium]
MEENSYLKGLNEKQKEAVLATEGPLLILAGAGAGKTKTITHRILHLIHKGVAPSQILAITFTNKSAKEMRERVEKLLSSDVSINLPVGMEERPFVSTFHSLGVHIIKENAEILGLPRHFAIYDRGDSKKAVKQALEEAGYDPKQFDPGTILGKISRKKGEFLTASEFESESGNNYMEKITGAVWQRYELILQKEKALDFDDLLLKTAKLLASNQAVLKHYQGIWKYIHIDEYQDTNKVQYMIAKLLAGSEKNIAVVGDGDQSIYSWRGANIQNILNFEEDYLDAKIVLLEENYRSTQNILAAANNIISKNIYRKDKNLFTKNEEGEKIGLYGGYDENDEANFIANRSRELIQNGVKANEIAVLYRANFQSRALEEAFLSKSIPYQLLGTKFFERKEVKDVLSYLRVALNPDSSADLKRVINVPVRGIGKVTLIKILAGQEESLPGAAKEKVAEFRRLLERIKEKAMTGRTSDTIKFIIQESGMEKMLKEDDEEKLENTRELVTLAARYNIMSPEEGFEQLLTDASLATDQDSLMKNEVAVKLMTVHASKGLEFDYVFVSGLEENLFPHKKLSEDTLSPEEGEEERRLFYVALTRARKKLYLTYSSMRTIFGQRQVNVLSEFITDVDDGLLENEEKPTGAKAIFIDF